MLQELAELGCFAGLLRGEIALLAWVGVQVVELFALSYAVGAPPTVVGDVFVMAAAQCIARTFKCLGD